jgi:hypothetical protein
MKLLSPTNLIPPCNLLRSQLTKLRARENSNGKIEKSRIMIVAGRMNTYLLRSRMGRVI